MNWSKQGATIWQARHTKKRARLQQAQLPSEPSANLPTTVQRSTRLHGSPVTAVHPARYRTLPAFRQREVPRGQLFFRPGLRSPCCTAISSWRYPFLLSRSSWTAVGEPRRTSWGPRRKVAGVTSAGILFLHPVLVDVVDRRQQLVAFERLGVIPCDGFFSLPRSFNLQLSVFESITFRK